MPLQHPPTQTWKIGDYLLHGQWYRCIVKVLMQQADEDDRPAPVMADEDDRPAPVAKEDAPVRAEAQSYFRISACMLRTGATWF
eukprot:6316970-Amphidinium_carterae.1